MSCDEQWGTIWDHINELRRSLIQCLLIIGIGFIIVLIFHQQIFNFLIYRTDEAPLLILGPLDGMILVFKTCFWLSLTFTAPFWGWSILRFIQPGLKESEKIILLPFMVFSLLFMVGGMALAQYITIPLTNEVLTSFNSTIGQNAWTLGHYINYVILIHLGHGIAAQITLILFLLVHYRFILPNQLSLKRRYVIVFAFILGALLTPPDILTQLLLALPLIALYEIAIIYSRFLSFKDKKLSI